MRIKSFYQFISEEISGTEIPQKAQGSYFGPAYGDTVSPNTINKSHTDVRLVPGHKNPDSKNSLTNDIFFGDDYTNLLHKYLQAGGSKQQLTGESESDIPIMLDFLDEK